MHVLKPFTDEPLWGGHRLAGVCGLARNKIGHLYSVYDVDGTSSELVTVETIDGKPCNNLHELFLCRKKAWGLPNYTEFPLVIALLDAEEHLSLQVHPDDVLAKRMAGRSFGKNESFFVLKAPRTGWMYDGCTVHTPSELSELVNKGLAETAARKLCVAEGDYIYIQAGTLHAATAGSILYEVEENCEITYRIWDFDRKDQNGQKRVLQVNEALLCVNTEMKSDKVRLGNEWQVHQRYSTRLIEDAAEYHNVSNGVECLTLLPVFGAQHSNCPNGKEIEYSPEFASISPGCSVLLEPGETLPTMCGRWIAVKVNDTETF